MSQPFDAEAASLAPGEAATRPVSNAAWMQLLALFRQKYPEGVLDTEVVVVDLAHDVILLKAIALTGDGGEGKGSGLATGAVTQVEQVVQRAKLHALADLGLIVEPAEEPSVARVTPMQPEAATPEAVTQTPTTEAATRSTIKPTRTLEALKAFYAKAYRVPVPQQEAQWEQFATHLVGRTVTTETIFTEEELGKLHAAIARQWQKRTQMRAS